MYHKTYKLDLEKDWIFNVVTLTATSTRQFQNSQIQSKTRLH